MSLKRTPNSTRRQTPTKSTSLKRCHTAIVRAFTGIPRPMRYRSDPPPISTVIAATVRVRIPIELEYGLSGKLQSGVYWINRGDTFCVKLYQSVFEGDTYLPDDIEITLNDHDVFQAAYFQLYQIDAGEIHMDVRADFAIEQYEFFGLPKEQGRSVDMHMRPMVVKTWDSVERPVDGRLTVYPQGETWCNGKILVPRLSWVTYLATAHSMEYRLCLKGYGLNLPNGNSEDTPPEGHVAPVGVCDFVVHVRQLQRDPPAVQVEEVASLAAKIKHILLPTPAPAGRLIKPRMG